MHPIWGYDAPAREFSTEYEAATCECANPPEFSCCRRQRCGSRFFSRSRGLIDAAVDDGDRCCRQARRGAARRGRAGQGSQAFASNERPSPTSTDGAGRPGERQLRPPAADRLALGRGRCRPLGRRRDNVKIDIAANIRGGYTSGDARAGTLSEFFSRVSFVRTLFWDL